LAREPSGFGAATAFRSGGADCQTACVTAQGTKTLGIRYVAAHQRLFVEGVSSRDPIYGIIPNRMTGEGYFASLGEVGHVRLSAVRGALARAAADGAGSPFTWLVQLPVESALTLSDVVDGFDDKRSPQLDVWLDLAPSGHLLVAAQVDLQLEDWDVQRVEQVLTPMLSRHGAVFEDADEYGDGPSSGNPWYWVVRCGLKGRGATVLDAMALGRSVQTLLGLVEGGGIGCLEAWDLVRAGRVQLLYGQPESHWLEVKVQGRDMSADAGKIELAQDVARFANGDGPGLMLVGLATKKIAGQELVQRGPGQSFAAKDAPRHHKEVDRRVYPPVDGLDVQVVPDGHGGDLLAFFIPAQPLELKPFLVHGAVVGGKIEGAFFSVVRRRGEHSIPITAQALHAQLAAGRAFLNQQAPLSKRRTTKKVK
jgi:hypothetical protein